MAASAGQRRGDVEIKSYLRDADGSRTWSSTCPSHTTGSEAAATCSRRFAIASPGPRRALRLAAQRKINSYRQQYADNQHISFPRHYDHFLPHARRVFASSFFYRPNARPRRTSMPLDCLRNKTDRTTRSGSTRGILHGPEEQSRPRVGKSSGVTDQPQYPRL